MTGFFYMHFGEEVPESIEKEYNRLLLHEQYLEKKEQKYRVQTVEFDGFICRDNLGKMITPNYVTQHFHYVVTKNGMKHLRFHDLRHSCASLLLAHASKRSACNYDVKAGVYKGRYSVEFHHKKFGF